MSTSALPDGLAALQKKRPAAQPARRTIEPSRNPARQAPYVAPEPPEPQAAASAPKTTPAPPISPERPKGAPRGAAPAKAPTSDSQNRLTVYVDDAHDEFMDQAKFAGSRLRPKVDVSRSAVVRFALERLQAEMTADQVASAIAAKPTSDKALGRKRR